MNGALGTDETVYLINTLDSSVIRSFPAVVGSPDGITMTEDGQRLFVSGASDIVELDALTGATISSWTHAGRNFEAIDVDTDGSLIALDFAASEIVFINPTTQMETNAIAFGTSPVGLEILENGFAIFQLSDPQIYLTDRSGVQTGTITLTPPPTNPLGLALSGDTWLVTDASSGASQIHTYDLTGTLLRSTPFSVNVNNFAESVEAAAMTPSDGSFVVDRMKYSVDFRARARGAGEDVDSFQIQGILNPYRMMAFSVPSDPPSNTEATVYFQGIPVALTEAELRGNKLTFATMPGATAQALLQINMANGKFKLRGEGWDLDTALGITNEPVATAFTPMVQFGLRLDDYFIQSTHDTEYAHKKQDKPGKSSWSVKKNVSPEPILIATKAKVQQAEVDGQTQQRISMTFAFRTAGGAMLNLANGANVTLGDFGEGVGDGSSGVTFTTQGSKHVYANPMAAGANAVDQMIIDERKGTITITTAWVVAGTFATELHVQDTETHPDTATLAVGVQVNGSGGCTELTLHRRGVNWSGR